jgi:hypothetical protein
MRYLILFLVIVFCSCRDKWVNCTSPKIKIPGAIAFTNSLKAADVDTLVVSGYIADNTFSHLLGSDTLINTSIYNDGAHLFADTDKAPFSYIDGSKDLGIYLPGVGKTFYLHALYSNDTVMQWTEKISCGLADRLQYSLMLYL